MTSELRMSRRAAVLAGFAVVSLMPRPSPAAGPSIHVVKGTGCECCVAWVSYLRDEGFSVTEEERYGALLMSYKSEVGVPPTLISCHTGMVEGYVLEGHVPAADIRRLLAERPDAVGLVVPGMPYGSPGMGLQEAREAYEVFLIRRNGSTEVFAQYDSRD